MLSFLSSIRWQDILDILLTSFILFRLYVLFRGTKVVRVVTGIALLWIFQRIALGMGLIVTTWIIQGIVAGAALIIIIVFRNEIRNVLQAKNFRAILWEVPQKGIRTPVDSIVEGVYELARNRIGALIVFPGRENVEETIHGGVEWQGLVSKEMLVSIFYHGNPVHDGAAVIEGDRVVKVGAILPLSNREDLPGYYGTRHRAAAGMAEQTDALVVVVSEERGKVVVAQGQTLTDIDDNLALKNILDEHLGIVTREDRAIRRQKWELGLAAMICVLCMGGVWFSFARGMETLTSLEVPLEYVNSDPRMQILSTSVNTVRLHLAGSNALIGSLRPDQVKVKLDISKAGDGDNAFPITEDNIALPPGVRINRIEPAEVQVVLDIPVAKQFDIQVDWAGSMPRDLILESVVVMPARTTLLGPKSLLERINTVYTEKVRLDTIDASGQRTVALALDSSALKVADGFRDKIEIRYVVRGRKP